MGKKGKKRSIKELKNLIRVSLLVLAFFVLIFGAFLIQDSIIGSLVGSEGYELYKYNVDLKFEENNEDSVEIIGLPEKFNLRSLTASGTVTGNGSVRMYLITPNGRFLILDKIALKENKLGSPVGSFIEVGSIGNESIVNDSSEVAVEETENIAETAVLPEDESVVNDSSEVTVEETEEIVNDINNQGEDFDGVCVQTCLLLLEVDSTDLNLEIEVEEGTTLQLDEIGLVLDDLGDLEEPEVEASAQSIYFENDTHYAGFESGEIGWNFYKQIYEWYWDSSRDSRYSRNKDDGTIGGTWSAHLQDDSTNSHFYQNFDFEGYDYVNISFNYFWQRIKQSEYVKLLCDSTEIWRYYGVPGEQNSWWPAEVQITNSSCTFDSSVKIQWTGNPGLSSNSDDFWVDGVSIVAVSNPVEIPPTESIIPSVTNIISKSIGIDSIYWTWTNPTDNFSEAIIYLDGNNVVNTSNNYYNATGLFENSSYTITVHTKDTSGSVNNTDVGNTAKTLLNITITPEVTVSEIISAEVYKINGQLKSNITTVIQTEESYETVNRDILRVTFSQNLTNNNKIAIYAQTKDEADLMVYLTNTITNSGNHENDNIENPNRFGATKGKKDVKKWYNVTLVGMSSPQNTFDLYFPGKIDYYQITTVLSETVDSHKIVNLISNLSIVPQEDENIDLTTQTQTGPKWVYIKDENGNRIGKFKVRFENAQSDIDLSEFKADADFANKKAFMHMDSWPDEISISRDLYIPASGSNQVYICPGASTLNDVNITCPGKLELSVGQTVNNITLNSTTIGGQEYYVAMGVIGTGGASTEVEDPAPESSGTPATAPSTSGGGGGGGFSGRLKGEIDLQQTECNERWVCTDWSSECVEGKNTRSCEEVNECGTEEEKPDLIKNCGLECQPKFGCTDWGPCTKGVQFRVCKDANQCGEEAREEFNECSSELGTFTGAVTDALGTLINPTSVPDLQFFVPSILLLVVLIALLSFRKKNMSKRTRAIFVILHVILVLLITLFIGALILEQTGTQSLSRFLQLDGLIMGILILILLIAGIVGLKKVYSKAFKTEKQPKRKR